MVCDIGPLVPMDVEQQARFYALDNAVKYDGKAALGKVIQRLMANHPELRARGKEIKQIAMDAVEWANGMSLDQQQKLLDEMGGAIVVERKERQGLPDLEGAEEGKVVMRFAPGPSGPLHLGHSRAAILNDEYCKRYKGKFILRLEDTNPNKIDPEAYEMIPQDLEWLGVKVDEIFIQSDRFDDYYEVARKLLEMGEAYICTCDAEDWRALKNKQMPCPHRDVEPQAQLELWDKMLAGEFEPGTISYVVKTDLHHKNPAVRDFVGFRIVNDPHPKTGDKYCVYPLYNFSVVVDDHNMGCTHILRGKDHLNNTHRQVYVYDAMGWDKPFFIHYGWVSIEGTILKTSTIREGIQEGHYSGWEDVRLGTFSSLKARGYDPGSLRRYWNEVGLKQVDITFSWENLNAMNKDILDSKCKRLFYIKDPVEVSVKVTETLRSHAPFHPEHEELGIREHEMVPADGAVMFYLEREDIADIEAGKVIRLKDLGNIKLIEGGEKPVFEHIGDDLSVIKQGAPIIHWVYGPTAVDAEMLEPDEDKVLTYQGKLESFGGDIEGPVQFERIGIVNLVSNDGTIKALFMHK